MPPVLMQERLYFMFVYDDDESVGILKYHLRSKCLSVTGIAHITILMRMEDGSLGFAHLDGFTLNLWTLQMRSDGVGLWTE